MNTTLPVGDAENVSVLADEGVNLARAKLERSVACDMLKA